MINILIIEDEIPAANQLKRLLNEVIQEGYNIVGELDAVKPAVKWFNANPSPDLIFMDIQLGDGLSFEIFEYLSIEAPIIFTTAYDQYAIQAFKVNSIDYLLKPFDKNDLENAFAKFQKSKSTGQTNSPSLPSGNLEEMIKALMPKYKSRFIIKVGEHLYAVPVTEALYFMSKEKVTYLIRNDGKKFIIDHSIDQVADMLDPSEFFRINRKYLINFNAINDMISFTNSRLKLRLNHSDDDNIIVSRERVQDFKRWLDR